MPLRLPFIVEKMSSRKATGTQWETAVVNYLRDKTSSKVFKPRQEGTHDVGDIHIAEDYVLQCKNWAYWSKQDIYNFIDAADLQATHAKRAYGAAVVKRRKAGGSSGAVSSGIVAMSLDSFAGILVDLEEGREALATLEDMDTDE